MPNGSFALVASSTLLGRVLLSASIFFILSGSGCNSLKGPELTLTSDRETIAAGGYEHATITASVKLRAKPAVGVTVSFETDLGSFSSSGSLSSTTAASDSDGVATVQLFGPLEQGQTEVRASYYDEETGLEATGKLTVVFGPPQAGNLPVDGRFHLDCPYLNLGAMRVPKPNIVMDCQISAQTTSGNNVPTGSLTLFFLAEAGVLEAIDDSWSGERIIRYSVRGGNASPVDVSPMPGEPVRTGSLGEERNPRDGVVTLLAIARGSESWTDLNGNGVRDDNEPYVDIGEPFLDVNDDGVYTEGVDVFFDGNGNGVYDGPNGRYDGDTFIGATTKVIWSGPIAEAPDAARIETEPSDNIIPDSGSLIMRVYLLDRNMNPVAAFGDNDDYLEINEQFGYVSVNPYSMPLSNTTSMEFDSAWRILQFLPNAGRLNDITLYDYSPGSDPPESNSFAVNLTVHATPGPSGDGYWVNQETDIFSQSVTGTVH